jgi:hypothetical protein
LSSNAASIFELQPHFPATPSCSEAVPPCEEMSVGNKKNIYKTTIPCNIARKSGKLDFGGCTINLAILYANKPKCTCCHVH